MILRIFLTDATFHCLKRSIPPGSPSKLVLRDAVHLKGFKNNVVLCCNEAEAENLLLYARHCPEVVASIYKALEASGFSIHSTTARPLFGDKPRFHR